MKGRSKKDSELCVTTVREQLKALREKRGLSQRELAERMGVSQPVVAQFETEPGTSLRLAMRVAEALEAEIRVEVVDKQARSKKQTRAA